MSQAHIAFAIPELDAGGPDRVIHQLLCGLPRDRFRLSLIVQREGGRLFDTLPGDVEVTAIGTHSRHPVLAYRRAVARSKPNLVMSTLRMNLTAGLARAMASPPPLLVARQANAIDINFRELARRSPIKQRIAVPLVRFALRSADALVAQSNDMAAELRSRVGSAMPIATIGNPVDIADIDAQAARQAATGPTPPRGTPSLVSVGRLTAQKGFDLLIGAMPDILAGHGQAELAIYGEGPDRAALQAQIDALGLQDKVHLAGQSNAVLAQVCAADVFISSSRYEGFSNAMLEAMALGTRVVATDCPGATSELIVDGRTGFLCRSEDAGALAVSVKQALQPGTGSVGAAARDHVATMFNRDRVCADYTAFFEQLIAASRR